MQREVKHVSPGKIQLVARGLGRTGPVYSPACCCAGLSHAERQSGEARTSVIGGHLQMMLDAISTMAPTV